LKSESSKSRYQHGSYNIIEIRIVICRPPGVPLAGQPLYPGKEGQAHDDGVKTCEEKCLSRDGARGN